MIDERAIFCFDLGSPYAYLAAERISGLFAEAGLEQPEWRPVLLGGMFRALGRSSWGLGPDRKDGMRDCEQRASAYGLPPIRWPEPWPGDMLGAMRAATFAAQIGRITSFALAAFRQSFAAGRDLSELDNLMLAGAASEIHPRALRTALERDAVKAELRAATDDVIARGAVGVPSVIVGERVFWGDEQLEQAVDATARERA